MSHQQDHDACIPVFCLEGSNKGMHSGTTRAIISDKFQRCLSSGTARAKISDKFQRCWRSAHQRWCEIFFWMCVIGLWLDPLFYYSLVINDDKKCLRVDKKLGTIATVLRSVMDFLYLIHVISKFYTGFSLPQASGRVVVHKAAWEIAKRIPLIDILSVLPLPQVVLLIIIPRVKDTEFLNAMKSFNIFVVLFQYVPRIIRIYPLFITFARTSGIRIGSARLNIFLYMLACHVVGAFWYLFAVERKTTCWHEACKNRIGCFRLSCDDSLKDYTFLTDSCHIKTPNATIFDFGIFLEALDSGIVDSTDFLRKFCYSFWFGLQSLSSLGQNLKTSTYIWEIVFAVIISIFGLILLVFLIGNMQSYLQFKTQRLEEIRLKEKEIHEWIVFYSPPPHLKKEINKYKQYKWRESIGVQNLLHNLPRDTKRDIMRHICFDVLKKVPLLQNMDKNLSDAIFDRLKLECYIKNSCVALERSPLDKMLFITQGTLVVYRSNGETSFLRKGNFYGEELLDWALFTPSLSRLPISKAVHAHSNVEAFVLTAQDLKYIVSKFMSHFVKELKLKEEPSQLRGHNHSPTSSLELLELRAVATVQGAWRCYHRKKMEKSMLPRQQAAHDITAKPESETTLHPLSLPVQRQNELK